MTLTLSTSNVRSEDRLASWHANGFFIVPDVLSPQECADHKAEALRVLRDHGRPDATVYVGCAVVSPLFERLAENPSVVEALKLLLPEGVEFLSDKIVYKKPGKDFATPWHIDEWYWKGTRPKISVWIPFNDATAESGTLTVIPGSHRQEWVRKKSDGVNGEFFFAIDSDVSPDNVRICEIKAGTAIFFSDLLLHGSTASKGPNERYAIISTYHAPGHEPFDDAFAARRTLIPSKTA